MNSVKEAVVARFLEILPDRRMRPNEFANRAGVTPFSVYSKSPSFSRPARERGAHVLLE